jgi:hypothetical protein
MQCQQCRSHIVFSEQENWETYKLVCMCRHNHSEHQRNCTVCSGTSANGGCDHFKQIETVEIALKKEEIEDAVEISGEEIQDSRTGHDAISSSEIVRRTGESGIRKGRTDNKKMGGKRDNAKSTVQKGSKKTVHDGTDSSIRGSSKRM